MILRDNHDKKMYRNYEIHVIQYVTYMYIYTSF